MVQGYRLPLVVEDRGPGRAWRRIRLIVQKVLQLVNYLVFSQCQLLGFAVRVLDDVNVLADDCLALFLNQAVPAELEDATVVGIVADCYKTVVEVSVGEKEGFGFESKITGVKSRPSVSSW